MNIFFTFNYTIFRGVNMSEEILAKPQEKVYVESEKPVSVASFIGMLIVSMIPVIGLICLIFWAAGNNVTKKNFAIAYLLLAVVMITIGLITGGIFYPTIAEWFRRIFTLF